MTTYKTEKLPDLHVLGTQLSKGILEFQDRFAALRKKCEHHVIEKLEGCVDKGLGVHRQGVGFRKDGKAWKLFFVEAGEHDRDVTPYEEMAALHEFPGVPVRKKVRERYLHWQELSQCSLEDKSKAVKLLRRLMGEMEIEYDRRTALVGDALRVLEELDGELPLAAAKEGE